MTSSFTRLLGTTAVVMTILLLGASAVRAQEEEPPRVGPVVVDLRGTAPRLVSNKQLADSRGLNSEADLPGLGLGAVAGIHVYPLRWRVITFGIGAEVVVGRAHHAPAAAAQGVGTAVTERFVSAAPQLSFNFRGSNGWSYISGGIGKSVWQIVPDGQAAAAPDEERIRTVNYGGGARWFIKKHIAFSLDVRIWQVDPGTGHLGLPGSPRANILVISAGVAVK